MRRFIHKAKSGKEVKEMAKVKAAKRVRNYTRGGGTGKVPAKGKGFRASSPIGGGKSPAAKKGGKSGSGGRGH